VITDKLPYLKRALGSAMEAADVGALIAMSPENFLHTSGVYVASQRMIRERLALTIFPRDGEPFAVVSSVVHRTVDRDSWLDEVVGWAEHEETPIGKLAEELRRRGLGAGRIALEKGYLAANFYEELQRELPQVEWLDAERMLDRTRMVKTPEEIELMKHNALLAEKAIWAGFMFSRVGTTEHAIAQRMISALVELGADSSPFMSLAAGSLNSREHHAVPGAYAIAEGDTVAVDMVGTFRGYYSDYARMAVVGEPSEGQRRAWSNVVQIQRQLLDDLVPGVTAESIFQRAARYASDCGTALDTNLVGHSLGIGLHEYPVLAPGCTEEIQAGMTLCVEILVMDPEHGRFHVEDLVEVCERGPARRLTTYFDTRELQRIQL
jgi:Xaa-Pro aminopeptidase